MSDQLPGEPTPWSAAYHFVMKALGWPPSVALFAVVLGWSLQQWTFVVAIIGGAINSAYVGWKWYRDWRDDRRRRREAEA
jgi:hypothetical protein